MYSPNNLFKTSFYGRSEVYVQVMVRSKKVDITTSGLVWTCFVQPGLSLAKGSKYAAAGVTRTGLVWTGLAWSGLVWPGLDWSGLVWMGLSSLAYPLPRAQNIWGSWCD